MTGNLAFSLREEGWVPLRFVLIFYYCFEWDRCCGGAGQRKDLHEALGAAGLLMANAISAGSKFHNLGPAPVNVLFLRVMSLFPLPPSLPPLPKLVGNFIVPVEYIRHVRSSLHKER